MYEALWDDFKAKLDKSLYFRGLNFGTKFKSMESSSKIKFTHNVDQGMIKIIGDGNFIYFIITIQKLQKIYL